MTQTTDAALVERLRKGRLIRPAERLTIEGHGFGWRGEIREHSHPDALAAADTIEAQARRIEALEGAAKLVARSDGVYVMPDGTHWALLFPKSDPQPLLSDIFAARAALAPTP